MKAIASHLLPTDDLRTRLDREAGGLSITLKNRGLDWLFYDLDGGTIVAHYFPAQSLLNVHAGGAAKPTFQANGVGPDDLPGLLRKHLGDDDRNEDAETSAAFLPISPIESDLSDRQRELLFRVATALAGNSGFAKLDPLALVQRARDIVLHATRIKAQDEPEAD